MTFSEDLIWWISIVEIPSLTALTILLLRTRAEMHQAGSRIGDEARRLSDELQRDLAAFKLEVARSYASVALLKDSEKRLTHHLLRIEAKLDSSVFHRPVSDLQDMEGDNP